MKCSTCGCLKFKACLSYRHSGTIPRNMFGVVAKLLRQTDLETEFGLCSAKDFNDFTKQLQKNNKVELHPPSETLQWLFEPDGLQTIPFPFALVALCEASTSLKKKTHGSLLHLTEQAGKQIPIYQFFNFCYHVQVRRAMHPARCTPQVQAAKHKVPKKFLEETPDSRSTLLAVCEKAAEDLKIKLEVATADTKVPPKEAARGSGVHPTFFADIFPCRKQGRLCFGQHKSAVVLLPGPMYTHFLDGPICK